MINDSPYTTLRRRKDVLLNVGFDYKGRIFEKTTSSSIRSIGGTFSEFLTKVEDLVYEMIENVKSIKAFCNFAMDKNERRFN